MQQVLQKTVLAIQHQAIGKEDFLKLLDLPLSDSGILARARKAEEAQATMENARK